jgi:hypothetical protein
MTKNFGSFLGEILHIVTTLEIVLAYFYALELFKPSYTSLFHGVIHTDVYSLGLLNQGFYSLILLLITSLALVLCSCETGGFKSVKPSKLACYVLVALTLANLTLLLYWVAYMWNPELLLGYGFKLCTTISDIDAGLFRIYTPLYPPLLLATLYAWLLLPIRRALKGRVRLKIRCNRVLNLNAVGDNRSLNDIYAKKLGLTSVLLLSIVLPIIPYLPSINPSFKPVSVDIRYYSAWLSNMLETDCWSAVKYAFYGVENGNRPLYLLMLYFLTSLGISRDVVLNFEALLISPFFALAIYYTAKRLSGSGIYAVSASLAGLLGFNMTVGMFAGLYAAWIALIPFYICIMSTLSLRESRWALAGSILTSTALLYIHPWTWCILMAILTLHLIIQTLKSVEKGGKLKVDKQLLAVLASNISMDSLKTATSPYHGGLTCSIDILTKGKYFEIYVPFGFEYLLRLPQNLYRLSTTYMCGLFYNPFHMLLAFIGVLSFLNKKDEYSKLILLWIATISAIFPFGSLAFQSHLLFAMPFPILIAEGLWALSRLLARFDSRLPRLFIIFFIVSSLTYTVRALCNLI